MARVRIYVPRCRQLPARHPKTKRKLKQVADKVSTRASTKLAAHRDSGDARIKRESGSVDEFVVLDDSRGQRAAAAIEFGHVAPNGRIVVGLHILTGSLP